MMVQIIRDLVFLYFMSESLNLTRIKLQRLCIDHVALMKHKYLRLCEKEKENYRKNLYFLVFVVQV